MTDVGAGHEYWNKCAYKMCYSSVGPITISSVIQAALTVVAKRFQ